MGIIINVLYEKSYTEINAYYNNDPEHCWDTPTTERTTVDKDKNAICPHQVKDCSRCSHADFLRREGEAGNNANDSCQQIDQRETDMSKDALQEDAQDEEIEHFSPTCSRLTWRKIGVMKRQYCP